MVNYLSELKDYHWINPNVPWDEQTIGFSITSQNVADAIFAFNNNFGPTGKCSSTCPLLKSSSKTNISTLLGGVMEANMAHYIDGCCQHPDEKGHPDLIPKRLLDSATKSMELGLELKSTANNSWASHHNQTRELLAFKWTGDLKNIQIVYAIYFSNLDNNDWSDLPPQKGRNTPVCNLLSSSCVKEKGFIVYLNGLCYDIITSKKGIKLISRLNTDWGRNRYNLQAIKIK